MNLSTAKSLGLPQRSRKRVGRGLGSGHGKTCGRGHKGQQSRSGYSRKRGFEGGQMPLYRRLPRRGFNNKNFATRYTIINVQDLEVFAEGAEVNLERILEIGLTSPETDLLKVLGKGELRKPLMVSAHKFSASAKAKIEAAGGQAIEITRPGVTEAEPRRERGGERPAPAQDES